MQSEGSGDINMTRVFILGSCLAVLAASAAHAAEAKKSGNLSAAQIVERNAKARGGLDAWRAVQTLRIAGEMDAGGKTDPMLPFVLSMKRPQKSRLEITFAGKNAVQVYDGTRGWKVRPFLNRDDVEPFTPAELKSAASAAPLDGFLIDHAKKGTRVELAGTERIEKKKNYKLKLTLKDGQQRFVWIDASTFLETKVSGEPRKLDGRPHKVAIFSRDYRTVDGLKVPFLLETAVEGVKDTHKMVVKSVAVNAPLADELFAKPSVAVASGR
jgi:hypothetical protein